MNGNDIQRGPATMGGNAFSRLDEAKKIVLVHAAALAAGYHTDADESAFFARSLENVEAQMYQVRYAELKATRFIPILGSVDPGAKFHTWNIMDKSGNATRMSNPADDAPEVNVQGAAITTPISYYWAGYSYSIEDLRAVAQARKMGLGVIELDTTKALVTREAIARKVERVLALGDAEVGVPGFLNHSGSPIVSLLGSGDWLARYAAASTAEAQDKIAFEVLSELLQLDRHMVVDTKEVEAPTTIILPTEYHAFIASTPASHFTPQFSILMAFKAQAQHITEVETWPFLSTADLALTGPRIVAYKRDPTRLSGILPIEFEAQPPQPRNMAFRVTCGAKCGGTIVRYPRSINYLDGFGPTSP